MKATYVSDSGLQSTARAWVSDYAELVKARLTFLVLLTTLVGFTMASRGVMSWVGMLHTLLATALVAGGAAALNQWFERDADGRMPRTRNRPLPSGRMQAEEAFLFGTVISLTGIVYLAVCVNVLTSLLAALTLLSYLLIYTPLKKISWLNTVVGAVPGAAPPLIGWAGARGELSPEAWVLFALMFFWQMPHFMAIAWIYRDDYRQGGFKMLPVVEPDGSSTARQAVIHCMVLLPISIIPGLLGLTGMGYTLSAAILGLAFLAIAVRFGFSLTRRHAWWLFVASIVYLPVLLAVMVLDKAK